MQRISLHPTYSFRIPQDSVLTPRGEDNPLQIPDFGATFDVYSARTDIYAHFLTRLVFLGCPLTYIILPDGSSVANGLVSRDHRLSRCSSSDTLSEPKQVLGSHILIPRRSADLF